MRPSPVVRGISALVLVAGACVATAAAQPRPATFRGKVYVDTLMRPIPGVEVTITELSRTATSDDKGVFRIEGIGPGRYRVVARKIGFAAYQSTIEFGDGETVERGIVLPRVPPLDTVRVVGDANVPLSFLEHRAVGLGHFVTRDHLEKQGNRKLGDILAQVPGLGMVQGRTSQAWVLSKRYTMPIRSISGGGQPCINKPGNPWYCPEQHELARGMKVGCYAQVYLDGMLMNPGAPATPVDINEFYSQQIEAIEYYAGPAQTPMKYSKLNSPCGVVVIHTRRGK